MEQPFSSTTPLPPAAIAALQMGRQIEAIKIVRQAQGLSLKDAKDRVDQYVASDPSLREKFAARQSQSMRGCLMVIAGLIALAGLGWFLFLRAKG